MMIQPKEAEERVYAAIQELREGKPPTQKCYFCDGLIKVAGAPPGGPYTSYFFSCPCKKSSGFLRGL
jgi:hypothetical protein